MENLNPRVQGGIRLGICHLELHTDDGHLSTCLLEGRTGTEARDHTRVMKYPVWRKLTRWNENRDFIVREEEPAGHDADHRAGHAAQRDGPAYDVLVAREQGPPAVVAQDGNVIVLACKAATEHRSDTQHVEEVVGDDQALQNTGFPGPGEVEVDANLASLVDAHEIGHAGKDRVHPLPFEKVRRGDIGTRGGFETVNLGDRDQAT